MRSVMEITKKHKDLHGFGKYVTYVLYLQTKDMRM